MNRVRPAQTFLQRMRQRVLVPLALAWVLSSVLVVAVSYASTTQAFDRALLDQAYKVSERVQWQGDRLVLVPDTAPAPVHERARWLTFAVYAGDRFLGGDPRLRPAAQKTAAPRTFDSITLNLVAVRRLTLRESPRPMLTVVVGEDMRERSEWLKRLVAYSIVPQVVLLLVLGWWLGHSLADETGPLVRLQKALEARGTADLQPLATPTARSLELASLTDAINGLMARIDRSVRAQREFAGDVAHELRTPLAGVRSGAEHALSSQDPHVWHAQLRQVVAGCDRAARMIEQLLGLALAGEARETLRLEPVRLDELVRGTLLLLMPRADAAGTDLGAEGLDEPVTVSGHAQLLEGVLRNLVDNALRHGRPNPGGAAPVVTVRMVHDTATVWLSVVDNGPGLLPTHAERLLSRWQRGSVRDTGRDGSGLGLAIVVRYCELMGASLRMVTARDGGLEAIVTLRRM